MKKEDNKKKEATTKMDAAVKHGIDKEPNAVYTCIEKVIKTVFSTSGKVWIWIR